MASLNNSYAPSQKEMEEEVARLTTQDEKLQYLAEAASYDFKCPDACDAWALKWLEENEEDLA